MSRKERDRMKVMAGVKAKELSQVQAELVAAACAEANSAAGRHSRKRRQHVMEGSFADALNNHGAKQARWRGLGRQKLQSWLIAAVQNLRILLRHQVGGPVRAAAAVLAGAASQSRRLKVAGQIAWFWTVGRGLDPAYQRFNHLMGANPLLKGCWGG